MYKEEDYLMISGIQHFSFCRRQWALIHVEQQWEENERTIDGLLLHENAHDSSKIEKRGDKIIFRGLRVKSEQLGVSGECDVVEFHKSKYGVHLNSYDDLWIPYPIEYKNGEPKENKADLLQLCCQAMCLEEMLLCSINEGSIFYGKTKKRYKVEFTNELRKSVKDTILEMHKYMKNGYTPKARRTKSCNACSLVNVCLPMLEKKEDVYEYIKEAMK